MKTGILAVLGLGLMLPAGAVAAERVLEGRVVRLEEGDNFWLTIKDAQKREHVGLCPAACFETLPEKHVGLAVRVWVRKGIARDGSGNAMAQSDSFEKVEILRK